MALANVLAFQDGMDGDQRRNCMAGYIFCWSLVLSFVFQCVSGFALFQIYDRAAGYMEDAQVFSKVVGSTWTILIASTFCVGLGLGLCAGFFIFDDPHDFVDPFKAIFVTYFCSGLFQLLSGIALLAANNKMQAYFSKEARQVEMSSSAQW